MKGRAFIGIWSLCNFELNRYARVSEPTNRFFIILYSCGHRKERHSWRWRPTDMVWLGNRLIDVIFLSESGWVEEETAFDWKLVACGRPICIHGYPYPRVCTICGIVICNKITEILPLSLSLRSSYRAAAGTFPLYCSRSSRVCPGTEATHTIENILKGWGTRAWYQ